MNADRRFFWALAALSSVYLVLISGVVLSSVLATSPSAIIAAFRQPEIRSSLGLSLASSTITAILGLWIGLPLAYLLERFRFPGRGVVELLLDVPLVLPPLVMGLGLLLFFQTPLGKLAEESLGITYEVPAVILAQFSVCTAFVVRLLRGTFAQLSPRTEQIAQVFGCTRAQAFWRITIPEARNGIIAAFTLGWAKALGEFGPVLIFAGMTRNKTEVLSSTIYLEMNVGQLETALAVSLLMIAISGIVLLVLRQVTR